MKSREARLLRRAARQRGVCRANRGRIAALKEASPCADCGRSYPAYVMDFDHVRGTKSVGISLMFSYSWQTILAEIAKCDLVCANCHRIRTFERGQYVRVAA